jgi:YegS/Rv2252/BmrU family lipid kinase
MPRRCTLIINPLSGGFSPARVHEATAALKRNGFSPTIIEAGAPDVTTGCARRICSEEENPLIIVGAGDGTINCVVNGLSPGVATLAVIPFGTSNVLAREVGITTPSCALEKISAGISRPVSVGLIEKDGTERYFLLMSGVGYDGAVVKGVRAREKRLLRKGAYLLSALRLIRCWDTGRLEVTADSTVVDCHTVIVCNGTKYGGDNVIAADASLFEPGFRIVCLVDGSRTAFLRFACRLLTKRGAAGPGVIGLSAMDVEIRGTKPLQTDGDFYCHAPVRIRSVPDFFRLIV